ncbi:related to vacuolar segregation protein PEP7 [Ustilago sp. UG-2017a]|nr:related to vacuolar segregation protein PEP7 [Ustilago sp. UG-2017a]
MTAEGAAGPSSDTSASAKRLSYVPYQRKGHLRNGSSVSQTTATPPEAESSTPSPSSASASHRPSGESIRSTASSSAGKQASSGIPSTSARLEGREPSHPRTTSSASTRQPVTPSRTASSFGRSTVASPLGVGLVRPHRDLDAPPPPLRVASKLASNSSTSSSADAKQVVSSSTQAQAFSSTSASNSTASMRHDRTQSNASASTVRATDSPRAPQKMPDSPRTSSRIQSKPATANSTHNTTRNGATSNGSANGSTSVASSTASSVPGYSKASSAVGSPHGSRSSTPIIGASGTSIPAHVNSYAALLAAQSRLGPIPVPQGVALAQAAGANPAAIGQTMALPTSDGRTTAYRSGFQPKGVLRIRTSEFAELRRKGRSEGEMEEQRMDRRLAKLIAIHFEPVSDTEKSSAGPAAKKSFASSFIDLDLDEFKRDPSSVIRKGGSDLWTSFRARGRGEDPAIRQAEQTIVNWQDDSEAKACPICATPFSFTVRKHHCRLCGRVVCASPHLTRLAWAEQMGSGTGKTLTAEEKAELESKCSGNIVADPITGRIEEVKEGTTSSSSSSTSNPASSKGVRVCHDCKSIIRKRQYMMDDEPLPVFMKLYEALMRVQKEIEQSLPEFQEMVLGLQKQDQTAALGSSIRANIELQRDAVQARKQLLANFATYDELAKRIRALPSDSAGDAAQERIQHAIFTRAHLFLQQNMLPLQSLPRLGSKKSDGGSDTTGSAPGSPQPASPRLGPRRAQHSNKVSVSSIVSSRSLFGGGSGGSSLRANSAAELDQQLNPDEEEDDEADANADAAQLREQLNVLLEQEKLVADYVESAAKARKFEDAKTLKKSHEDLCKEILRIQRKLVVKGPGR